MSNAWLQSRFPRGPAAALAALHLSDRRPPQLQDADWRAALDFCDGAHLTLPLREAARDAMPDWVRERVDGDAQRNLQRMRAAEELYRAIHQRLAARDLPFLALKGLAHCPDFTPRAETRVQYDIDLFVPAAEIQQARDSLLGLGYESFDEMERFPTDHLPPLIRKTGWEWRGDFFDAGIPYSIELHFRLWNPGLERLPVTDVEDFWQRRVSRPIAGVSYQVLSPPDALGYACLHVLRHVLRGSTKPFHVYEVAGFLQARAADQRFWSEWQARHSDRFRQLQAVVFRLAGSWFGGDYGPAVQSAIEALPPGASAWFARPAASPPANPFASGKDELGLHLSLLESRRDSWPIVRRRLFPASLPGAVDAVHIPESQMTLRRRLKKHARYLAYIASRIRWHAAALPQAAATSIAWWWRR